MALSRGKKMVEMALKRKYPETESHQRADYQFNSEDESLRQRYLNGLFASLEESFEEQMHCMVKGDGGHEEEEGEEEDGEEEMEEDDEGEDEGEKEEVGEDEEEQEGEEDVEEEEGGEGDVMDKTYVPGDEHKDDEEESRNDNNEQASVGANRNPLRKPCSSDCKKRCTKKIPENRRAVINSKYVELPYPAKKSFIFHMLSQKQTVRPTTGNATKRVRSFIYHLDDDQGQRHEVCKVMFLSTLGYHPKNDRLITTVFGGVERSSLVPPPERRGRHAPGNKLDASKIHDHIESYHPTISHYRREHAPNRRYLPSDVTVKAMFLDYKHRGNKCSYETYRKAVKDLNISFTKLGEEECEHCLRHDLHLKAAHQPAQVARQPDHRPAQPDHQPDHRPAQPAHQPAQVAHQPDHQPDQPDHQPDHRPAQPAHQPAQVAHQPDHRPAQPAHQPDHRPDCSSCVEWEQHKERAASARSFYRMDAEKEQVTEVIRSVDLQKVIMLPRMPGVKTAVFTRRVSAFHETFATVGKSIGKGNNKKTISVVWHEGIAGRSAAEVASAFVTSINEDRDAHTITYWVDNCTAQNKNWTLLTTLVKVVNSDLTNVRQVTLKYFEPGHTFMSADSFHHGVEKSMKKVPGGVILDISDFKEAIASSNSGRVKVIELNAQNILDWSSGLSVVKLRGKPHLAKMAVIQLRRGSRSLFFKMSHDESQFSECDFLKKKVTLEYPGPLRTGDKGIEKEKKRDIVAKLCPLMPPHRRHFWQNMAEEE